MYCLLAVEIPVWKVQTAVRAYLHDSPYPCYPALQPLFSGVPSKRKSYTVLLYCVRS